MSPAASYTMAESVAKVDLTKLIKVRTVTVGLSLPNDEALWRAALTHAKAFTHAARARLNAAGYEVQTVRLCTNPFEEFVDVEDGASALAQLKRLATLLDDVGVDNLSLGPAATRSGVLLIPGILRLSKKLYASAAVPDSFSRDLCTDIAGVVLEISKTDPEANFQFCAAFNVPPGVPFYPAAYHRGAKASFALGCETSALLWDALPRAGGDLREAQRLLREAFQAHLAPLELIALALSREHGVAYGGIDASVAPAPDCPPLTESFASLDLGAFGESGTLAVSALVTGAVKAVDVKLCGYSGLMLPVLEDVGLATSGLFRVHDLLMYSAVCGIGLDTVPVPGDVPQHKLAALMLDVAALAFRLNKPLSARLFPVPGKRAGELTDFKNPFLCNGPILDVP
ncbi:hypothetical protein M885DRAFT_457060 [Pelagophyceae sp. CCMP2097]|nr:hypothetical protein M885DRAFT_457060 [Pelagophyceae sp. CCMP2097]